MFIALIIVGVGLFFSSENVQTRVANQLTKRINNLFTTNISIGKARINLQGEIDLNDILIRDHRQDSLLYVNNVSLNLNELENVLKGEYRLSSVKINRPSLFLTTYATDSLSNVQLFLKKFKRNNAKKKALTAGVNALSLYDGTIAVANEKQARARTYNTINFIAEGISFENDTLISSIKDLSFVQEKGPNLSGFKGELMYTPNDFHFKDFDIESESSFVRGSFNIKTPEFKWETIRDKATISLSIAQSRWDSQLIPIKILNNIGDEFKLTANAQGTLNEFYIGFDVGTAEGSNLLGKTKLSLYDGSTYTVQINELKGNITRKDVESYLPMEINNAAVLKRIHWENLSLTGQGSFVQNKTLSSRFQINLNQGGLNAEIKANRVAEGWEFSQHIQFLEFGKGNLVRSDDEIYVNGDLEVVGSLSDEKEVIVDAKGNISSLHWNNNTLEGIQFDGSISNDQRTFSIQSADTQAPIALYFNQNLNQSSSPFILEGESKGLNLSAFGLTPPNDQVRVFSKIFLNGNKKTLTALQLKDILVRNKDGHHSFSGVDFRFLSKNGIQAIEREGNSEYPFVFRGNFTYNDLPFLIENSIREALLLPITSPLARNQNLVFDFTLDKNILTALYPGIDTQKNIQFSGELSTSIGVSSFDFALPFIAYKGYEFEDISLTSSLKNQNEIAHFEAGNIQGKGFKLSNVFLITKNKDDLLFGSIGGQFGYDQSNNFAFEFSYKQEQKTAIFNLNKVHGNLENNQWSNEDSTPIISYLGDENKLIISDFKINSANQSLGVDGYFSSLSNYAVDINSKNLVLSHILPKGEKFNFDGQLSAYIKLAENEEEQIRSANLEISDLVVNEVLMGDFEFVMGGSSQLKTYPINLLLNENGNTQLLGNGTLFMAGKKPNLSLDLKFEDFNLAFLSALGKDKITNIKGDISGNLNLWGEFDNLKLRGDALLDGGEFYIPSTNVRYVVNDNTLAQFQNNTIGFLNANIFERASNTSGRLTGQLSHLNFNAWELDLSIQSNRLLVYDRPEDLTSLFYGQGYLNGEANFSGPTKLLTLEVTGSTAEGTSLVIPWQEDKGLSDTSYIDFIQKGEKQQENVTADINAVDEAFRGFEMLFNLDVNRDAELEIVVDQSSGSTLSGRGAGNILIETNIDGKFNIWGDFIAYDGIYNFKNLGLIDKKFAVKQGGTIVWEGDPLEAQLNIEATYEVPGGANPALLVDNPNFNRKIPTNVEIQLIGNLIKPDDPIFDISFPNTTDIVVSEINYRLADQERRQLQAISLLSQGIFISDVAVSLQGITNNLYEKASDVFSTLIGANEGKLNVGLNYQQGEVNPVFDLRTEDRIGLTLSTQLSDRILINGKIGVPIDGVQETVIVGNVQIDFILNESGTLKVKVFNRENDFRYLGDEFGYTQGMGMSYQVDFNTFNELIQKIKSNASQSANNSSKLESSDAIDFIQKEN